RASTPAGLREVGAAAATLLIVVAHGVYDASQEFPAGLALAGGILRREDIMAQGAAWPPEVLLLACGSARGVARFGDDTATHLGAQFLAGGARCVLVSRGDLELSASSVLVEEMLRERARGLDVGRAAAAGRRALAAHPETRDLFHRGLVALHGVIPRVTPARLADPLTARADIEPAEGGALALDRASLLVVVLVLGALAAGATAWVRSRARRA
ncbi:MAG: CHAT domain-containing protein, partial [Planctomycetes bacterium]|nr:CHAT domain-containing protein [Planctomycetota bacterium]